MCLCQKGSLHGPISRETHGHGVSQGINHFRGSLGLLQTAPFSVFGTACALCLSGAIKPFAARVFCLCANISVGRRMITTGEANYEICNCSPVTVTKGFKGETGPYKTCLF